MYFKKIRGVKMKISKTFKTTVILTLFIFSFQIVFFSPNVFPQSIKQVEDKIGGSGGSTTSEDSSNDNTFLYIVAGAIVVGLIVWKVFLDKKEPKSKNEIKTDTTKTSLDKSFYKNLSDQELQFEKIQNQIPFEIFLGVQNNAQNISGENLSLALKIKL
jgi:hypothetical protein